MRKADLSPNAVKELAKHYAQSATTVQQLFEQLHQDGLLNRATVVRFLVERFVRSPRQDKLKDFSLYIGVNYSCARVLVSGIKPQPQK